MKRLSEILTLWLPTTIGLSRFWTIFLNCCFIPLFAVEGGYFADFELLVDEYVNMLVAGGDTTANTLEFVFMELGRHPDICQR